MPLYCTVENHLNLFTWMYCLKLRFNVTFIRKASGKKKKKIIIINWYNKQDIKQRFIVIHLFCGQTRTAAMKYFIFMWIFILWMSLIQPVILGIYIYGLQNDSMCLTHKVFACVVCISFFRWSSSSLSLHFSKKTNQGCCVWKTVMMLPLVTYWVDFPLHHRGPGLTCGTECQQAVICLYVCGNRLLFIIFLSQSSGVSGWKCQLVSLIQAEIS